MNGFLIYKDNIEAVRKMDNETAGKIFKAIYEYIDNGKVPEKDEPLISMLFEFWKVGIDHGKSRHAEISKARSKAGKKGALKANSKYQQKPAKVGKSSELENKLKKEINIRNS